MQAAHPTGQNGQWAIIGTTDTIWTWDSDTSAWVNSGAQIDLSNYYTIPQANSRFEMPIGFIFQWLAVDGQSVNLTTPEKVTAYFGYGTWRAIAQGQFLIGQSSTYAAGSTGGEAAHALTEAENGPHIHTIDTGGSLWGWDVGRPQTANLQFQQSGAEIRLATGSDFAISQSGAGKPHNNMPPYLSVYTWQRIA